MITKISCYNQNFTAANFPSGRIFSVPARRTIPIQSISSAGGFFERIRHFDCNPGTGWGSIFGAAFAALTAWALKTDAKTYFALHSAGMIGGGVVGRKIHHFFSK